MKALSVKQPWASLMITGTPDGRVKRGETRTWPTRHRGPLLIVSSKTEDKAAMERFGFEKGSLPLGQAIGIVDIWDCQRMVKDDEKLALCPLYSGAWIWRSKDPAEIKPFPVKGRLGIYEVECEIERS